MLNVQLGLLNFAQKYAQCIERGDKPPFAADGEQ